MLVHMPWDAKIIAPPDELTYWGAQSTEPSTTVVDAGAANLGVNRAMLVFSRTTPAATREDRMAINLSIGKQAGTTTSYFDATADLNACKTAIEGWWTSQRGTITDQVTLLEIRWYRVSLDHLKSGPPLRVDAIGVAGQFSSSRVPDQLSATITFKTASRKHWGRVYIPGLAANSWDTTYGRLTTSRADSLATYMRSLIVDLNTAGFEMCVWSRTARSVLHIYELHVDDVPDIQRRRRPKQRSYLKVFTS